jgi:hypothetical protein
MTSGASLRRERLGWAFGLNAPQLGVVTLAVAPILAFMAGQRYTAALGWLPVALVMVSLVVVPIKGRVAVTWLTHWVGHTTGTATGWSTWQSQAAAGHAVTPENPDLPGVLTRFQLPDGPPMGEHGRVCLTHDTVEDRWGATARLKFAGIGMISDQECAALGASMGALALSLRASRRVDRFSFYVRTVPDDGAKYQAWREANRVADVPPLVRTSAEQMARRWAGGSVVTEAFLNVSAPEEAISTRAKDAGGGVTGRGHALHPALVGLTDPLSSMGVEPPQWLTGQGLAEAIRTGFNPAAGAGVTRAHLAGRGGLPLATAGPVNANTGDGRVYHHDGYATVSFTLMMTGLDLPFGALAPLLAVRTAGERRALAVHCEVISTKAAKRIAQRERQHTTGLRSLKASKGFGTTSEDSRAEASARKQEDAVAAGHALLRTSVVVCTTVPAHWKVSEHADALENDIVSAFVPVRLDLVQDAAFVAACIPVGLGLHRVRGEL